MRTSSASACGTVRGKPSMMNPPTESGCRTRLRIMPIMMSSGTYWPAARMGWAWRPRGVPDWISARSMSPVAMCGMPKRDRNMFAWVPLPLPGAPYSNRFIVHPHPARCGFRPPHIGGRRLFSPDEAAVLAHDQLRLQLLHRVQRHTHHDQDRRASEVHLLVRNARDLGGGDGQDHGYEAEVVRGRSPRTDAGDEARVPLEVVRHLGDLECDRCIEVREGERECEVERVVSDRHREVRRIRGEVATDPRGGLVVPRVGRRALEVVGDDRGEEHHRDREDDRNDAGVVNAQW